MTSPQLTGIDPFVPWSTFSAPTINIPRGLFYGGCFYTSDNFVPPCHISYITRDPSTGLSTWGISDASNTPLAAIQFTLNIGHIFTLAGSYAGCLKGRYYNFNASPVDVDGTTSASDLSTFLNNITGTHQLDPDTLILDCCNCYRLHSGVTGGTFNTLELPADSELAMTDNGQYYIKPHSVTPSSATGVLKTLKIITSGGSAELTKTHISIAPWCTDLINSGGYVWNSKGVEDVAVAVIDNGIVIGTHKALSTYGA